MGDSSNLALINDRVDIFNGKKIFDKDIRQSGFFAWKVCGETLYLLDWRRIYYMHLVEGVNRPFSLQEIHIAIIGENGSGKSALTVKYLTKRFICEYDPNIEDTYCKQENIGGRQYMIWVMDTVESKNRDPKRYLGWADVIIVVYSVTDAQSFEFAENLLKMIARHDHSLCNRPHTVCLYGNKIDLDRYRQVSKTQAQLLGESHNSAAFYEGTTCETYLPIKTMFHELILRAAEQRRLARETSAPTGLVLSPALTPKGSAASFHSDGAADSPKPSTSSSLLGPMTASLSVMSSATPDSFLRSRSKSPAIKLNDHTKGKYSIGGRHAPSSVAPLTSQNSVPPMGHQITQQPAPKKSSGLKLLKIFQ